MQIISYLCRYTFVQIATSHQRQRQRGHNSACIFEILPHIFTRLHMKRGQLSWQYRSSCMLGNTILNNKFPLRCHISIYGERQGRQLLNFLKSMKQSWSLSIYSHTMYQSFDPPMIEYTLVLSCLAIWSSYIEQRIANRQFSDLHLVHAFSFEYYIRMTLHLPYWIHPRLENPTSICFQQ